MRPCPSVILDAVTFSVRSIVGYLLTAVEFALSPLFDFGFAPKYADRRLLLLDLYWK